MTTLFAVEGLSVRFGGLAALTDVSFTLAPGEICAVIGPNGAGKTTLFNAITGVVPADRGSIRLRDKPLEGLSPRVISALGVRRTFQNGGLFGEMSVLENLLAGLHAEIGGGFLSLLFGAASARRAEAEAVARARLLLGSMGLDALADQLAKDLSGGQQRMVEILRAIATEPPLLLLDEPAVGLSPAAREQLAVLVRRLARERGVAILLIEHAIDLVMGVSDRVMVLADGRKIAEGTPDAVRADREVLEAYLGRA